MRATIRHNQACHVPPFPPTAALIPAGSLLSLRGSGEPQASIPAVPFLSFPHVSPSVIPARLKRESIFDVVGKIWNLPNTVLGLVAGGAGYAVGKIGYALGWYSGNPSIQFGHNGIQFLDNPFIAEGGALTLGNAISYSEGIKPGNTGAYYDKSVPYGLHEEAHTYQSQVLGPAFIPTYLLNRQAFERAAQNYGRPEQGGHWWPW